MPDLDGGNYRSRGRTPGSCVRYVNDEACVRPGVERLEFVNTLCGGWGFLDVCPEHLAEWMRANDPLAV